MPVDYTQVDAIAAAVADVYAEGEQALLALITRQLQAGGFDDGDIDAQAAAWAHRKLREVQALRRAAVLIVDRLQSDGGTVIRTAIADGLRAGNNAAIVDLAEAQVGPTGPDARTADTRSGNAVQALADAAVDELRPVHSAVLRATVDDYRHAVAGAAARRLTGTRTTRQAAQDAWAALSAKGITGFTDKSGRRWSLSAYVEMATRAAVARAAVVGQTDHWLAAGIDNCYVEDNPRECPICRPWESQILSLGAQVIAPAIATLAFAQADGLHHPNCRHALRLWRPGVRIVAARKPEGAAGYDAEQHQRYLERKLRGWRNRYAAAFDDAARQHAAARIAGWADALEQHLQANPRLPRLSYREHPGPFAAPRRARGRRDRAHLKAR